MGNLIKDFWSYEYKEKKYFGIIEVIKGEDLAQNRHEKKYETHIEKALDYTMKNDALSHMSLQTYCTWLNDRSAREADEQKYYPFILEFESRNDKQYLEVVYEVAVYINYLITELSIHKDDILVMMNNSKSFYVFVNPKVYGAKPEKDLHKVYFEMYKNIKKELGLKYVDESIVTSAYKLMKTPNTYYKGGYFVNITIEELMQLLTGIKTKAELTKYKRSLNREVPSEISLKAARLYSNSLKIVRNINKKSDEKTDENKACGGKCVRYLLQHMVEKGYRNYGLVSVAIYLKSIGYSKEEVKENLIQLAESWNHDENPRDIEAKVNTVFRKNYKFSCNYAKAVYADLGIENMCDKCPFKNKKLSLFKAVVNIDASIINELWKNNASTRHYELYLNIAKKGLFNKSFNPEVENISDRTIRELCNLCSLERIKKDGQVTINYKPSKSIYKVTEKFIDQSVGELGDYIKHYLRLFTKAYKAVDKYVLVRMSRETLMDHLGYTDISSLYKFIKKLTGIGLLKESIKTNVYSLYYETFKVIDINEHRSEEANEVVSIDIGKAVIGQQITFYDADEYIFEPGYVRKILNKKLGRGSPGAG